MSIADRLMANVTPRSFPAGSLTGFTSHELILAHVTADEEGIDFEQLKAPIESEIPDDEKKRLGKVSWPTESVILELETRGDLIRVPDSNTPLPKRITRHGS